MSLIKLVNIKKTYISGENSFEALRGVNLEINEGEFVAIMGASGSGKSTMMHIIGCLDVPSSGSYFLDNRDVAKLKDEDLAKIRNEEIGFVFQSFNLLPRLTVLDNVLLPFTYFSGKVSSEKQYKKAMEAIDEVGLTERVHNKSNQLSGGQVQRTAIARSLVLEPKIILADEPTGNLDSKTSVEIMQVLAHLNEKGNTIILVTHEEDIANFARRRVKLKDGMVIEDYQPNKSISQ
jgi:putative ABC transport system ATP-binding protein